MYHSRRTFLATTLATAGLAAVAHATAHAGMLQPEAKPAPTSGGGKKLRILILGGTGFLGPACSESALSRGHTVTLFNRGRTEARRKEAGRPSNVPDGTEVIFGNRDPKKTADDWKNEPNQNPNGEALDPKSPLGLSQLAEKIKEGVKWDAVIDTSAYFPRIAKASAELLAPAIGQYIFISTLSVYAKNDVADKDESDGLAVLSSPDTENFDAPQNYGGGKAACEAAAEAAMPGRVTSMRAGFIVGARDSSRRFLYWPVRASKGGEMIVPGSETDPIQIIDVRDLADFVVHCAEHKIMGVFNTTGPANTLTMRNFVDGCIAGTGSKSSAVFIPADFLEAQGVNTGTFPLWIPPSGDAAGFHQRNIKKALAAGITFRPIADTAKASIDWYNGIEEKLQAGLTRQMDPAKEAEVIKAFRDKQG